jgi:hypothetical protein
VDDVDPLFDKPYIFNARGQGLATYTKQGTLLQLADISLKMLSPVGGIHRWTHGSLESATVSGMPSMVTPFWTELVTSENPRTCSDTVQVSRRYHAENRLVIE